MFQPPRLTNAGKALYNRTLAGEGIQFTKIKLGKGTLTDPIATMTALVDLVTEIDASVSQTGDNSYVDISGSFSNAGMQDGFYWREIGLFAADPEAPDERERDILYCYQNAYDTADFIPAASVEIVEKHITIPIIVADTENVSCLIDRSLIFVTQSELIKIVDKLQDALEPLLPLAETAVTSVNDVSPNEATGNVALVADNIPCQVYKTQFQGSLQKLIDELCDGIELDYTQIYEEWKKRAGGDSSVRAFFLSDEIIEPGAYVVYAAGYTWKLRYTTAKGSDGSAVWRWVESYSEDGFFSLRLYAEQDAVLIIEPDGDGYRVYDDEFALKSYVDERTEKDVTAEYEAWYPTAPPNARQPHHFLLTLPDGQYRLTRDGYQAYRMSRITTPVGNVLQQLYVTQEQFFYFYAYVNDDLVCELSTEENYFLINGRRYATEEFVEKQIAAATNDLKSYIDQKIAQALGG